MRRSAFVLVLAMLLWGRLAQAQTVAVGPYYATPSWDQTLACTSASTCPRFVVLPNFSSAAVLDRETGLVWEQAPNSESALLAWGIAQDYCAQKPIGGHMGWRVPTLAEFGSLLNGSPDPVFPGSVHTSLPAGHPFTINGSAFWTATRSNQFPSAAWYYNLFDGPTEANISAFGFPTWCVRGPAAQ